jgi:hypothetical protein
VICIPTSKFPSSIKQEKVQANLGKGEYLENQILPQDNFHIALLFLVSSAGLDVDKQVVKNSHTFQGLHIHMP